MKHQVPKGICRHCLPDCETTKYESSISYAKLQKCESMTTGSEQVLCNLVKEPLNPTPWVAMAQTEFDSEKESIPWYLDTSSSILNKTRFSNKRLRFKENNANYAELFPTEIKRNPTYDAFEDDIGIINVYFAGDKISKFVTANRMSINDFMSRIGGSLGLGMGISFISIIELIYWFTIRLSANILK